MSKYILVRRVFVIKGHNVNVCILNGSITRGATIINIHSTLIQGICRFIFLGSDCFGTQSILVDANTYALRKLFLNANLSKLLLGI